MSTRYVLLLDGTGQLVKLHSSVAAVFAIGPNGDGTVKLDDGSDISGEYVVEPLTLLGWSVLVGVPRNVLDDAKRRDLIAGKTLLTDSAQELIARTCGVESFEQA